VCVCVKCVKREGSITVAEQEAQKHVLRQEQRGKHSYNEDNIVLDADFGHDSNILCNFFDYLGRALRSSFTLSRPLSLFALGKRHLGRYLDREHHSSLGARRNSHWLQVMMTWHEHMEDLPSDRTMRQFELNSLLHGSRRWLDHTRLRGSNTPGPVDWVHRLHVETVQGRALLERQTFEVGGQAEPIHSWRGGATEKRKRMTKRSGAKSGA
jgi:hypothetical protein